MIGYEEKELMAAILEDAANHLGRAVRIVDIMAKRDIETVRSEPDNADLVAMDGPKLIKAIRSLQRRYQR